MKLNLTGKKIDSMGNNIDSGAKWYSESQLDIDRQLVRFRYNSIRKFFTGKTCLELGPADGVMTRLLVNDFENLDVVDGSQKLLDLIPDSDNLTKYCSMFESFTPVNQYDTIIMEHVLEHIELPGKVLSKVYGWLSERGILIVGVPNARSLHRLAAVKMGLLQSEYTLNERDLALGHFRVYDIESLRQELTDSGFRILDKGGVFLKTVSNLQIQNDWTQKMIDGFYELGKDFQDIAAEIFVVAAK